ncbi:MAG: dihydrofolate reductase family protein [Microbacterium sp.]|uniref:dihydrofolate reductase family protein n=1 Tax=Microbacterium sp. TaxID=51671 RepID=UPI001ACBCB4E|nr:dihydrofolate reductase family protein [Microbacterium sp.]MBN9175829.1 dihydrofolate reductase family protein [Microbacterium sp.]
MGILRYAINVTLDGCCHHEAGLLPDAESMRYWTDMIEGARALLYGRVTYEMMRDAWRRPASGPWPEWMDAEEQAFAHVIDAARKHVVTSSSTDLGWNAERVEGDLAASVRRLRDETDGMILVGGVTLPAALADAGLIDEYVFVVQPVVAGLGPTLLAGLRERMTLQLIDRRDFSSGAVALRYRPA